jgi:hypothetical protein
MPLSEQWFLLALRRAVLTPNALNVSGAVTGRGGDFPPPYTGDFHSAYLIYHEFGSAPALSGAIYFSG